MLRRQGFEERRQKISFKEIGHALGSSGVGYIMPYLLSGEKKGGKENRGGVTKTPYVPSRQQDY